VIGRSDHQRCKKGEGPGGDCSRPSLPQTAAGQGSKDHQDWERGQEQAINRAVDEAAPDDRRRELQPVWVRGRILSPKDDQDADAGEDHSQADGPSPAAVDHFLQRLSRVPGPGKEQADRRQRVEAVVEVPLHLDLIGEDERDKEGDDAPADKPCPMPSARSSRMVCRDVRDGPDVA
jgi:hypothetical protein